MFPDTIHTRLDPMTLNGIAAVLHSDFDHARSWRDLKRRLAAKGYSLREQAGRVVLVTTPHGVELCRIGAIGFPTRVLARALGRFS